MKTILLAMTAALLSGAGAPAQGAAADAPRPVAPLASYVSQADYPPAALSAHQAGTTSVRLLVFKSGRVIACEILTSSGSETLDAATCHLIFSRAQFTPAHDAAGKPVTATYDGEISWTLPPAP